MKKYLDRIFLALFDEKYRDGKVNIMAGLLKIADDDVEI